MADRVRGVITIGSTFEEYRKVYGMLEDEVSRRIYLSRLNYLLSGNEQYIRDMVDTMAAHYPRLANRQWYHKKVIRKLIASLPPDRGIVLYGAGKFAKETIDFWKGDSRLIGFCSKTKDKQERGYLGYPVISPEELLKRTDLSVVVNIVDTKQMHEVLQILKDEHYPQDQIYTVTEDEWEFECVQYFAPDLITFAKDEVFIDAGCFDLYSSIQFRKYCGDRVKKIYAFEPDPQNYTVCLEKKKLAGLQEAEIFPMGTWSCRTALQFCVGSDGDSAIAENGETSISAAPIDEIVDSADQVTMIKMDVEGAELESLKGAREIIQKDKPKLAICMYHKLEDMTEIPLYIKKLVPEYQLYVRHYSTTQLETVLYAIMPQNNLGFE